MKMDKEVQNITKMELQRHINALGKSIVLTKNKHEASAQNFRPNPKNSNQMLDGYWIGRPRQVKHGDYAAHFIERNSILWIGQYAGVQEREEDTSQYSIIIENPICYRITDLNDGNSEENLIRNFLKKNGSVIYTYYHNDREADFENTLKQTFSQNFQPEPKGNSDPEFITSTINRVDRDNDVRKWILNNSNGICECCENPAPFKDSSEAPYLEVHHLVTLADGGPDTIYNTVAVCPNCHRQLHLGINKENILENMYKKIKRLRKS